MSISSTSKRREEVERVIRSCLVARKGDVSIPQLDRDYEEFEGERIPFKEFHFSSLTAFLESLKHVLKIVEKRGYPCIIPIESEKSRHVSSLVEGQRPSRKPSTRRLQRAFFGFSGGRPQVSINSKLMMMLVREINLHPDGINIDWAVNYVNKISRSVEITRSELERQLKEIDHEVRICGSNIYPARRGRNAPQCSQIPIPQLSQSSSQSSTNDNYQRSTNRPAAMSERTPYVNPKQISNGEKDLPVRFTGEDEDAIDVDDTEHKFLPAGLKTTSPPKQSLQNGYKDQQTSRKTYQEQEISHQAKDHNSYRENVNSLRDSQETSKEANNSSRDIHSRNMEDSSRGYRNNSYRDYGEPSYEDSQRVPNATYNGDGYEDEDDPVVNDDHLMYEDFDGNRSVLINEKIQQRLAILIQGQPDGIWCADLPQKYLDLTGVTLNYIELGFDSVREFASHLPNIFHCIRPTDAGDYKLYNAQKPAPDLLKKEPKSSRLSLAAKYHIYDDIANEPEVFPGRLDARITGKLIPEGVMEVKETVGHISVTELGRDQDYEEVVVSEVFTPSFFWIQLRKKLPRFEKFMHDLHSYYEINKAQYKIALIMLEKGLNVACIYDGKWHRGIIKSVLPDGRSHIHFYDYGTVKTYNPEDLYFLHRQFSCLPAQAIPCGLYNVKPYNATKWSKVITWEFVTRTSVPLIATIGSRDEEENSMLVTLTDTRGEEDFHINDWMYAQKFADQGRMAIDLKNLCDYEERKLPKWSDLSDDGPEDLFSTPKPKKTQQRPPPGFSALNSIHEESPPNPVNSANFTIPNTSNVSNLSTFLNTNLLQNSFLNFGFNFPNPMFYQNGLNSVNPAANNANLDVTKMQMDILKLEMQLMMSQSTPIVTNSPYVALLQEQLNALKRGLQEMLFYNAQQAAVNINLKSQQIQNLASSQPNTPSPSSFVKFTETPRESPKPSDLPSLRISQQNSPANSMYNFSPSQNVNETNNCESSCNSSLPTTSCANSSKSPLCNFEMVDKNRNFWESEKKIAEASKPSSIEDQIPANFSINMEEFFKKIPKLREKTETSKTLDLKDTNPFKADLVENKHRRSSLKTFYDTLPPEPSEDPKLKEKPKTEYVKISNIGNETNSDLFVFSKRKEEDREKKRASNLGVEKESLQRSCTPPSHNFAPVVTSSPEKVKQQGSKIFYEAGPVLYNKTEAEKKTESNVYNDTSFWKPIPPAEPNKTREPSVRINVSSFSLTKPKSLAQKAKEQINRNGLDSKSAERNSSLDATNDLDNSSTSSNVNIPSPWANTHILYPGKMSRQDDTTSDRGQEINFSTQSNLFTQRSAPAEIYTSVTEKKISNAEKESDMSWRHQESPLFSGSKPPAEICATIADGHRLLEPNPEEKIDEDVQMCFNNRGKFVQVELNLENTATGHLRNTNPFMEDIKLANSQKEADRDLNGISRNLESIKLFEQVKASSRIEASVEPPPCQDDSSVCFIYQLNSKDTSIIVINLSDEGWLSTDEFVYAFTDLTGSSVMLSLLNMMNLTIPFKVVDRASHPSLLAELDITSLNVPRDSQNRIVRPVHLTPLKSTLRILTKLKVIKREEMNAAMGKPINADGTVLSDMMKLISSYGTFMRTKCKN